MELESPLKRRLEPISSAQTMVPTEMSPIKRFDQRTASLSPTKLLPLSQFQQMAYSNKEYIIDVSNQVTDRSNQQYISNYYKNLQGVMPSQQYLSPSSLKTLESPFKPRAHSVAPETKLSLFDRRRLSNDMFQESQNLLIDNYNDSPKRLPAVNYKPPQILQLNKMMQEDARQKVVNLITRTQQQQQKKEITAEIISMPDYRSTVTQNPFALKLVKNSESSSDDDFSNDVLGVIINHQQDIKEQFVKDAELQDQVYKEVRQGLKPAERIKFDEDSQYARNSVMSSQGDKTPTNREPERDFNKLKAKIKLKSIKKFQEDVTQQKLMQEQELMNAQLGDNRLTSAQRNRKKHAPVTKRRSFTEVQLKFDHDTYQAPNGQELSLTDLKTIEQMKKWQRFPVSESLLNKPANYWLKIDSIMTAFYSVEYQVYQGRFGQGPCKVPQNSDISNDEDKFDIESNQSESDLQNKLNDEALTQEKKKLDPELIKHNIFNIDKLIVFPHKSKDGEVNLNILKEASANYIKNQMAKITELQSELSGQYSDEVLQQIFEHYCELFQTPVLYLPQYIRPIVNGRKGLIFTYITIGDKLLKAICCTIPFLHGIYELQFTKNQITDIMSTIVVFAIYANPGIKSLQFTINPVRTTFNKTFKLMLQTMPSKLLEINLAGSFTQVEQIEALSRSFSQSLQKLNLSSVSLNMNCTRHLNKFLLQQDHLKELNLQNCKLNNQSARYIIDALNRNCTIRHLYLAQNDFGSTIFEFGIKLGAMMTRHPTLLHADFSQCNLTRQETMLIVVCMSASKSFLSLHISKNELPYYERIFLRTLLAAKVVFNSRNAEKPSLNKDRNQVLQLGTQEFLDQNNKRYLQVFNEINEKREKLDFTIEDLIKELDMERVFTKNKKELKLSDVKEGSKLNIFMKHMRAREKEIKEGGKELQTFAQLNQVQKEQKLTQIAQDVLNASKDEPMVEQAQNPVVKEFSKKEERSPGELALLFMGVNQAAFDMLIENPMAGYMNEVIFTRILGADEIEQANYWQDCSQCYICQKWSQVDIKFDTRIDTSAWQLKILKLQYLQTTIKQLNAQCIEAEAVEQMKYQQAVLEEQRLEKLRREQLGIETEDEAEEDVLPLRKTKISIADHSPRSPRSIMKQKMQETMKPTVKQGPPSIKVAQFQGKNGLKKDVNHFKSQMKGIREERQKTPPIKVPRPSKQQYNSEHPIAPRQLTIQTIQKQMFPEQFMEAKDFIEEVNILQDAVPHSQHDKYMQVKGISRYGQKNPVVKKQSMRDLTKAVQELPQPLIRPLSPVHSVQPSQITYSVVQSQGVKQRGVPQIIQRSMFVGGMVYVIQEEVYSDSEDSSVYTSEDDFEEDKGLDSVFIAKSMQYQQLQEEIQEKERLAKLNPVKTEKELRLEKLGIVDESKKELTDAQKEYRTKIWPKYYIPAVKEYKSEQMDLVGQKLQLKVGGVKEGRRSMEDRGPAILSGPNPNTVELFLVASFTDWMPMKLKTKRALTFEKMNPDEPIPKAIFVLDNTIFLYSNYVAPGNHYFYFANKQGSIILSPSYQIVKFKETNVYMNSISVQPLNTEFDAVHVVKGGDEEEVVFIKDRSVFKDYKDDTKVLLRKCFDQDIIYSKIQRTVKNAEEELEDIKEILFKNFVKLNNIFLYYIGISTYPTIGMNDFTSWAKNCNCVDDKWINLAALDRILITTNVALHGLISSAERDLNRYEFLEILVRLANALYKESKVCATTPQALVKFLQENIFPNSKVVDGEHFRRFQCYNVKVNDILEKNATVIRKIYDQYTHNKKRFVTLAECRDFVLKSQINVSQMQTGVIFAESMQTIVDTIIDQTRPNQMNYCEFLVFLCRITYEHYRGSPYEHEMMYLKLEKLLPQYLQVINAQPLFLFGEDFEYKPMVKKTKKRVPIVKKDSTSSDDSDSSEKKEVEEEEESSSEDDLGECILLEEGKFKLSQAFVIKLAKEKAEKEARRIVREENKAKKAEEKAKLDAEKEAARKQKGALFLL